MSPYIGRPIGVAGHTTQKLDDPASISSNAFVMKVATVAISPDAASLQIYVDGVRQEAGVAYTVSGSTITFTGTFTASNDFQGYVMGDAMYIQTNSVDSDHYVDGSIDNAHVATGLDAVKIADGSVTNAELQYINTLSSNAQTQLTAKAPLASPTLTGTPAAPTASAATNTTQVATTAFVRTEVSNLVDSAPGALDTLNELAAALGDDASFSTTVTNSIATKLPLAGGTLTGTVTVGADTDGHDVKFFGDTTGKYMLWDESADKLLVSGIIETTDLVLHNERGHYTIVEEEDYLSIKNENTGKKYKFVLEEIDE